MIGSDYRHGDDRGIGPGPGGYPVGMDEPTDPIDPDREIPGGDGPGSDPGEGPGSDGAEGPGSEAGEGPGSAAPGRGPGSHAGDGPGSDAGDGPGSV